MLEENLIKPTIPSTHPKGLWFLSVSYAIFFFSYISLISFLVLYLMSEFHFSDKSAYNLFGSFNALIWSFPVLGGLLAERLGYKRIAALGYGLLMLGLIIISLPTTLALYLGLATFILGYGFATPATFSMIGLMYAKEDPRRDSAFTLLYVIFNAGGLLSITSGGYLIEYIGYHYTLLFEALMVIFALVMLAISNKHIKPYKNQDALTQTIRVHGWKSNLILVAVLLVVVPFCAVLLYHTQFNELLLTLLFIGVVILMLRMAHAQTERTATLKLYALLFLQLIALVFWALYFLEPSLLTVFIETQVDRHIGSFIIPASTYYALDGFFVIIFGYWMSKLWWYLDHRKRAIPIPHRFSVAIVFVGLGYLTLVIGLHFVKDSLLNMNWIVWCYFLIVVGELLVGPISFAMVGKLSPPGKEGVLMGAQQLFMGSGALLSGYLAELAATPQTATAFTSQLVYLHAYLEMAIGAFVIGGIVWIIARPIQRLIRNEAG